MSLWKNYGGVRYFLGKCSFQMTRFEQVLGNRTRMLELGLTTPGKHFDTYPEEDWEPDLLIYQQYKAALDRFERKEIVFEEKVETCPAEPSSPTPPSYSTTSKRSTKGKERKIRNVPVPGPPENSHPTAQVEQAVQIKREPGSVVTVQSTGVDAVDKAVAPPDMADFEMLIGTDQEYFRALQALVVNKDVCAHLSEAPVDLPALLAQLEEDEEGQLLDEIALAMLDNEILSGDGLTDMIQELAREFPTVADLKREVEREMAAETEEVTPVFGEDFEEKERQFLTDFLSLYRDFESMDEDTYHKKVRALFREFNRIHIPDDDVTPTISQKTTTSAKTPDLETTPEHATAHSALQDTSPATYESATTPSQDVIQDCPGPSTAERRKEANIPDNTGAVESNILGTPCTPTVTPSTSVNYSPGPAISFLTPYTTTEARVEDPVTEQASSPVPEP